ncbi:MAG: hypothetical protein GY788_01505 [bacterium]|nr:hypothetical protein [bacterium]
MAIERCPNGDGDCVVPDVAAMVDHGEFRGVTADEIEELMGPLDSIAPDFELTADERTGIDSRLLGADAATTGGEAVQFAPLSKRIRQVTKGIVVVCQPCGHYWMHTP